MSEFKKELVSIIKWMWLITFAALAFYIVTPKQELCRFEQCKSTDRYIFDKVTGKVEFVGNRF